VVLFREMRYEQRRAWALAFLFGYAGVVVAIKVFVIRRGLCALGAVAFLAVAVALATLAAVTGARHL
jgi:hypothetical protein